MIDASKAEKSGNSEAATAAYLQATDILLLLAKVEQNYTTWKSFTDKADYCQQKVKGLIALRKD